MGAGILAGGGRFRKAEGGPKCRYKAGIFMPDDLSVGSGLFSADEGEHIGHVLSAEHAFESFGHDGGCQRLHFLNVGA